jgi:hypothetical protein
MNTTGLLEYFRSQMMDEERPYLWSDTEVMTYMNEAQMMFCRLSEGIADASTPEVVNVPVVLGELRALTHPSILTFRMALLASSGAQIEIVNHTDVRSWTNQIGQVRRMIVGLEPDIVRWGTTPDEDDEVNLTVFRLPLLDLVEFDQDLEIPTKHHAYLLYWMQHLAYLKPDTEVFDKKASDRAKAAFEAYCEGLVSAETRRQRQKPRVVQYGGI